MLEFARKIALKSPHPTYRHAALVLRGGALLSYGVNRDERHAEYVALKKLWPSKRRGTTVLSVRITRSGSFGMARPCQVCNAFLEACGVSRVYFTDRMGRLNLNG